MTIGLACSQGLTLYERNMQEDLVSVASMSP